MMMIMMILIKITIMMIRRKLSGNPKHQCAYIQPCQDVPRMYSMSPMCRHELPGEAGKVADYGTTDSTYHLHHPAMRCVQG